MYQLHQYLEMMNDDRRMVPLEAALRKVIRRGDVVLDLGAGAGVLSFIALDAGAEHVYAIERSPAIEVARAIARASGLAERVTFIQADAREVAPARLVDCMVGDVRGALPLLEDNIALFESVKARWLRPGGKTVPLRDQIVFAPVASPRPHERISGWGGKRREARYEAARIFAANTLIRTSIDAQDVLAPAATLGLVSYEGTTPAHLGQRTSFVIERDATLTGLGVWFEATLADGVSFDTSPFSPPSIHAQGFFPLLEPRPVRSGEKIEVELSVHRTPHEPVWAWSLRSSHAPAWNERHSTIQGTLLGLRALPLLDGSICPSLSEEGRVARAVLDAMDGKTSAPALATRLAAELPDRFRSADDALAEAVKIAARYSAR